MAFPFIPIALGLGSLLSGYFGRKSEQKAQQQYQQQLDAAGGGGGGGGGSSSKSWSMGGGTFGPASTSAGLQMPQSNMSDLMMQYLLRGRGGQ